MQRDSQRRIALGPCARFLAAACAVAFAVAGVGVAEEALPPLDIPLGESVVTPQPEAAPAPDSLVAEVRIVGNQTIPASKISGNLITRQGRPFDEAVVHGDARKLADLDWFVDVKTLVESTPQGKIVIFQVVERPTIRYVKYVGNEGIKAKTLAKQTGLKAGGSVDPYAVEDGKRKLRDFYATKGYNNVQISILEGTKVSDQGVVYLINEGQSQRIWKTRFVGNDGGFVSDSRLKTLIKSKPPILYLFKGYVDRERIDGDIELITNYYRAFGYFQARVSRKLDYNEKGNWVDLTFVIHEGPQYQVRNVQFMGNSKFEQGPLAEKVTLKGGEPFEQSKMETDAKWIQDLHGSHGYVFAVVKPETVFLEQPGQVDLIYKIEPGDRFRVGRIFVHIGGDNPHTRIQTALNRVTIRPGQLMDIRELNASERRLVASSLFESNPANGSRPKITFRIPEDEDLELANGRTSVRGQNPLDPGPPVLAPPSAQHLQPVIVQLPTPTPDGADLHIYCEDEAHFARWQQAELGPDPPAIEVAPHFNPYANLEVSGQPEPEDDAEFYYDFENPSPAPVAPAVETGAPAVDESSDVVVRGQSPEQAPAQQPWWLQPPAPQPQRIAQTANPYQNIRGQSPGVNQAYAAVQTTPGARPPAAAYGGQVVGATGPESASVSGSVQPAQYSQQLQPPAGSVYPQPLSPLGPLPGGYSVDPTSPLYVGPGGYPEGTVDIHVEGQETQTGRLMVGVGVNSDAGVVGNVVIDERNFDWTRPPTSWEDVRNGSAWRGAGQRFRIDAAPGSQVQRYLVSFQEPYLFDEPISLGLSGSYFDRRFRDWDEQRVGGRVSLGHQWVERDLSATIAYRGENIKIHDPSVPTGVVPELDEVIGDNQLHGFRLTVIRDTRDNGFLATQGTYFELGGEQVIGTFDYPRVDADFRKYWMLYERPDHSGRHVLSYSTTVGYSGTHTPIYEHYFAGGFATLRGFDFRGASPLRNNVELGGEFQWLNSLQYLFPITADDMLHGVVFCDFGTVEENVTINDFRVAPGAGLRITVPAMGPAPIALDFAWAVNHADFDDREVFSFSLGFSR